MRHLILCRRLPVFLHVIISYQFDSTVSHVSHEIRPADAEKVARLMPSEAATGHSTPTDWGVHSFRFFGTNIHPWQWVPGHEMFQLTQSRWQVWCPQRPPLASLHPQSEISCAFKGVWVLLDLWEWCPVYDTGPFCLQLHPSRQGMYALCIGLEVIQNCQLNRCYWCTNFGQNVHLCFTFCKSPIRFMTKAVMAE